MAFIPSKAGRGPSRRKVGPGPRRPRENQLDRLADHLWKGRPR